MTQAEQNRIDAIMFVAGRMANMLYNLAEWDKLSAENRDAAKELVAKWDAIKLTRPFKRRR